MPLLDWVNRNQAEETATQVPYHLLKFEKTYGDEKQAKENLIIQGDNLQALKALLPLYGGQVKCIFIDPPYNTQSAFEHYDDKLEHAQWLSMMYPRLQLLKELLAEDGSIWITLDDNESHYLKVLCDEVFSRKNFVRNIVWQKKYTVANDSKGIPDSHDHILVYRKSDKFLRNLLPRTEKQNQLYKYDDNDGRGRWRTDNLTVKTLSQAYLYPITNPNTGKEYLPSAGRCWLTSSDNMVKLINENRIYWGKKGDGAPQLKRYLSEVQDGILPTSWWTFDEVGHNDESRKEQKVFFGSEAFSTPKPERLITQILKIATNSNDMVLDSFLGSGTTAAVAHKMSRRYIGIEMGEHAKTHVIPRLEKVIEGEQGGISKAVDWQGGGGFSFYTLGSPVFDDNGFLNSDVKFKDLASYVWWLETKFALNQTEAFENPFLGVHDGTAYYLLYNGILGDRRPNGGNVLTSSVLNHLNECHAHDGKRIVIGEASRLSPARLEAMNIEFKQIPYSLYGNKAK
ncbi:MULTISPECIES: site-specific DNA-methyltransferase [Acinetobacter]|nr:MULTISPECIES: site-specific DNA-methyltransferase [Acinetobacter]EFF84636.1 DNA (cytosine-5-)-methyltransferase [Acinetobacter sp. SH024]EXB72234.1 DNA methylase family protein [Acinetobacter sp. 1475718]KCX97283.1 DNA methylase family protein [Acinetobacter sp. 72431]KQF03623.1 DNA methylase [Acinetobacter pittii]MBJ8491833.1 site-specific DNA-methyltransferase [Acinetobacter pittii]